MLCYGINTNKSNDVELNINEIYFPNILEEFILYKLKCISSIKFYFKIKSIDVQENEKYNINNDDKINYGDLSTNIDLNVNINIDNIVNNIKGIKNSLNECYIISTLQCLIHCKTFMEKLFNEKDKIYLNDGITNEFLNLCET